MEGSTGSRSSPLKPLKWYKGLNTQKGRAEAGFFMVEGPRAIEQIISGHPGEVVELLSAGEIPTGYRGYQVRNVTESQLRSISSNAAPQDMIAVVRMPRDTNTSRLPGDKGNKLLLLEDVQDPGNVGTLIRTAAAFDFSGVILSEKCADPFAPKCVQSTAGTVLSLWLRRTPSYLDVAARLRESGYSLVAADLAGTDDPSLLQGPGKLLMAVGNEAAGLSSSLLKLADHRFRIPINREKAESLNAAVAGALCMYISSRH
jgi:TrmH family RNA methyltransferase